MQPDITAWLKAGRVSLEKVPCFLTVWAEHPIKDLKVDLADTAAFLWKAKMMHASSGERGDLRRPEGGLLDARDNGFIPVHALQVEHDGVQRH